MKKLSLLPFLLLAAPLMALWAAASQGGRRAALQVISGDKS